MSKPDDGGLERDYCANVLSLRELGSIYGLSDGAIRKRAIKNKWVREEKKKDKKSTQVRKASTQKNNLRTSPKTDTRTAKISLSPVETTPEETESSFHWGPEEFGLSEQQAIFCEHVAAGKTLVEAYRLAGYLGEGSTAHSNASRMRRNARVSRAIRFLSDQRQQRLSITEDEIIHQLSSIASADPNELVQYRRVNCRYCWGERFLYFWRDIAEFDKASEKASKDGKPEPEYGGVGFVETSFPNPDCPKCNGDGETQLYVADTTLLEGPARWLYAGIKQTQHGLEMRMANQEAARRDLLKLLEIKRSAGSGKGDTPGATKYTPEDYHKAQQNMEDEFKDLD